MLIIKTNLFLSINRLSGCDEFPHEMSARSFAGSIAGRRTIANVQHTVENYVRRALRQISDALVTLVISTALHNMKDMKDIVVD